MALRGTYGHKRRTVLYQLLVRLHRSLLHKSQPTWISLNNGWTFGQKREFLRVNHVKKTDNEAELDERLEPFLVCNNFLQSSTCIIVSV